jgi:hypothetical protein
MIVAGISIAAVQLAKGGASTLPEQASPASSQRADSPRIENAKLETRAASASLDATMREIAGAADKAEWLGYGVDRIAGERGVCCNNNWNDGGCGTCRLEKESGATNGTTHTNGNVKLEGARQLVVLYRLEAKQVVRIRIASEDCTLDAGGLPFIWLTGVKPPESVALLETYLRAADFEDHGDHGIGHGALTAIALHGDVAADRARIVRDAGASRRAPETGRILDGRRPGPGRIDSFAAHGKDGSEFRRARSRCLCVIREPRSRSAG